MPISTISNGEAGSSVRTSLNQAIDFVNSLGTPTTVGISILDSTNPSAVTFLRANADNTVTWLSAADFTTAIGAASKNDAIFTGTRPTWDGSSLATQDDYLSACLLVASNLGDLSDAAIARANLGLGSIATQASNAVSITGGTITGLTNLGVSMANNTAMTGFALGTISDTTSRPFNISQTFNNAGLTGTVFKMALTNTSSNAASKLMDLCAGASGTTSMFSVTTAGALTCAGQLFVGTSAIISSTLTMGNGITLPFSGNGYIQTNGGAAPVLYFGAGSYALEVKNTTNACALRVYGTTTGSKYLNLTHDGTNAKINSSSGDLHISGFPTSNPGPGIIWYDSGTSSFKMGT